MKYDKKMIRAAIKQHIDEDNDWRLYGRGTSTSWNKPIPKHHFYMRNNGLKLRFQVNDGEVVDEDGNVIAKFVRKWSTRKTCLAYRELMPTIEWM